MKIGHCSSLYLCLIANHLHQTLEIKTVLVKHVVVNMTTFLYGNKKRIDAGDNTFVPHPYKVWMFLRTQYVLLLILIVDTIISVVFYG